MNDRWNEKKMNYKEDFETAMKRRQPRVASATTASEAPMLSQEKEVRL